MIEIERKFLVKSEAYKKAAFKKVNILQGFLNTDPERTVRVRIRGAEAYLTVKGESDMEGLTRFEWEKEIGIHEALSLIDICEPGIIDKTRHLVKIGKHVFEVDEFFGDNQGLVVAELELTTENEIFPKPEWLGEEVTGQFKYFNSQLSKNPFKNWKNQ